MAYEFNEQQNKTILDLSKYMKLVAIVTISVGIIDLIYSILNATWIDIIYSCTIILVGLAFYFPTDNLTRIVDTQGSDIKELMQAFSELDKGWTVVLILLILIAIYPIFNLIV